jgi:hypothetical protein
MGYGSYSYAAHEALSQRRASLPQPRVFAQTACHAPMAPKRSRFAGRT